MSWDTLEPTEYGLVQNGFTGYVDLRPEGVYTGGRYFVWLRHYFLNFPRNRQNLDFDVGGRRPPIPARTGPDPDDKESGGQPVTLSVAFQYRFERSQVPVLYRTFSHLLTPSHAFSTFSRLLNRSPSSTRPSA